MTREKNTCFIKTRSLTACQKQTRQVIKIPRHGFVDKGVKKTLRCRSRPPGQIRTETNLISEPLYFEQQGALFGKP